MLSMPLDLEVALSYCSSTCLYVAMFPVVMTMN